jgi:uncharacterized repeat protein (TIGR01451 family)
MMLLLMQTCLVLGFAIDPWMGEGTDTDPVQGTLTNVVFVTAATPDSVILAANATATATYGADSSFVISKMGSYVDANADGIFNAGDNLTYVVTLTNNGTTTITGTSVIDTYPEFSAPNGTTVSCLSLDVTSAFAPDLAELVNDVDGVTDSLVSGDNAAVEDNQTAADLVYQANFNNSELDSALINLTYHLNQIANYGVETINAPNFDISANDTVRDGMAALINDTIAFLSNGDIEAYSALHEDGLLVPNTTFKEFWAISSLIYAAYAFAEANLVLDNITLTPPALSYIGNLDDVNLENMQNYTAAIISALNAGIQTEVAAQCPLTCATIFAHPGNFAQPPIAGTDNDVLYPGQTVSCSYTHVLTQNDVNYGIPG